MDFPVKINHEMRKTKRKIKKMIKIDKLSYVLKNNSNFLMGKPCFPVFFKVYFLQLKVVR